MKVRQLDRIADLLDLRGKPTDVGVADVRHFLKDELFDLCLGNALVYVAGASLEQQGVACPQWSVAERLGQPHHTFLVGVRDDECPVTVLEDFLEHDDLAHGLVGLGEHDIKRLVEHNLLAGLEVAHLHRWAHIHPHLAAASEHIHGAVIPRLEEGAETRRRLRQPVHLFLQRDDLIARLSQGCGQSLVLAGYRREVDLGVAQALLEHPSLPGRIREPTAEHRDLFLEEGDLRGEVRDLLLMPRGAGYLIASWHTPHLPFRSRRTQTLPIRSLPDRTEPYPLPFPA